MSNRPPTSDRSVSACLYCTERERNLAATNRRDEPMKATGALRDSTDLRAVLESWGIRTKHTDQPVLFWLFEGENFMPTRSIIVAIAFLNGKKTLKEITEEAGN